MKRTTIPISSPPRDELVSVWSALADGTRRGILDLLRVRPMTTGEIAARFPTSRFAIMKHLTALEAAGLVVVRRMGRERWNHLNVMPLQMLYERWVSPYQALWANKLIELKTNLEGDAMLPAPIPSNISQVELEIEIQATPAKVWKALTRETTDWWPKDFYSNPRTKGFHLEAKLGGRMYEDLGDDAGVIWFQVFAIDPQKTLDLQGCMAVPYGPAHTLLHLELVPNGKSTILKVSDSTIGLVKSSGEDKFDGWKQIFEGSLKAFVESGRA